MRNLTFQQGRRNLVGIAPPYCVVGTYSRASWVTGHRNAVEVLLVAILVMKSFLVF